MSENDFNEMSLMEREVILMNSGKHFRQVKHDIYLLNLYSVNDFFVEVYYSLKNNKIEKIDVLSDVSRIGLYIEEKKLNFN